MPDPSNPSASPLNAARTLKVPLMFTLGPNGQFLLKPPTVALPFTALPQTQVALAGTLSIPLGAQLHPDHELQLKATLATFLPNGYTGFQQPSKTGVPLPSVTYIYHASNVGVNVMAGYDPSANQISVGISKLNIFNRADFEATVSRGLSGKEAGFNSTLAIKFPVSIHEMKYVIGAGLSATGAMPISGQVTIGGSF